MSAEVTFKRAAQAYRNGDFVAALKICEELSNIHSDSVFLPEILNLQALSLAAQGIMLPAFDCIQEAIQLKPENAMLRNNANRILLLLGRNEDARQQAETACALAPDDKVYRYQLALVHYLTGDSEEAEKLALRCVDDKPVIQAWFLLNELAMNRGDTVVAAAHLRELVKHDPGNARAWAALAATPGEIAADGSILQALEAIEAKPKNDKNAASAVFALADRERRAGNYQAAFALYRKANQRLAEMKPFAIEEWEDSVQASMAGSRRWLESQGIPSPASDQGNGQRLVFIVGMPRSGTSLCEQILCSHPEVYGGGELVTMGFIEDSIAYEGIDPYGCESQANSNWLSRTREAFVNSLPSAASGFSRVIDKTPHNFERLGLIFRLFPAARVIWCLRHPLDTIISCYFQDFLSGQQFSNRLEHAARMYIAHVHLMRHWLHYFADSIKAMNYEEMVQNPETTAREMAVFLGLDFNPAMLQPHLNPRPVRTASSEQVKRPIYTTSLNNWRHYRQELAAAGAKLQAQGLLDQHWRSTVLG